MLRLKEDLTQPPHKFGLPGQHWTGGQLAKHLGLQCGISLGVRHCRNMLRQLATSRAVGAPRPAIAEVGAAQTEQQSHRPRFVQRTLC
jgi:hypothetical protein